MAFILLLLLSVTTLVRVESATAATSLQQLEARQNAMASAMVALGELQRHAGPDQRISARSDILNPTGTTIADAGERFWTGIWDTEPTAIKTGTATRVLPGQPFKDIKERGVSRWLINNPTPSTPLDPQTYAVDPSDSIELYVDPFPGDDDRSVTLNLSEITDDNGGTSGKYAWWVSDEGVKASVGLADQLGTSAEEKEKALLSVQRVAPKLIKTENDDLKDIDDSVEFSRISGLDQLGLLLDGQIEDDTPRELFHDVTTNHQGLPVDVRQGGFKKDLTWLLGDQDQFDDFIANDNRGALVFGGVGELFNATGSARYAPETAFDPRGTQLGQAASGNGSGNGAQDPGGPSWEQLRRFYNVGSQIDDDGATVSNSDDTVDDRYGIYPILTHYQIHVDMVPSVSPNPSDPDPDNQELYDITPRVYLFPFIRIWNPYSVRLKPRNYYFAQSERNVTNSSFYVSVDFDGDGDGNIPTDGNDSAYDFVSTIAKNGENNREWFRKGSGNKSEYIGNFKQLRFYVRDLALEPGQSVLLALKDVTVVDPSGNQWKQGYELEATSGLSMGSLTQALRTFTTKIKSDTARAAFWLNITEAQNDCLVFGTDLSGSVEWEAANKPDYIVTHPLQYISRIENKGGASDPYNPVSSTYSKISHVPLAYNADELKGLGEVAMNGIVDVIELNATRGRLGASNPQYEFPATGYFFHLKTLQNHVAKNPLHDTYDTLPLALNNPRSSRHGKFAMSASGNDHDNDHNHLYHTGKDHWFNRNLGNSAYSLMTQSGPSGDDGVVAFGLSDDYDTTIETLRWTPFELPEDESYFTSIGSLSHAKLEPSGLQTFKTFVHSTNGLKFESSKTATGWNPAYPIGNSLSSMYIGTGAPFRYRFPTGNSSDTAGSPKDGNLYDWSYLLNDTLWDSYFFSSFIEPNGSSTRELYNPRYRFDESIDEDLSNTDFTSEDQVRENYSSIGSRLVINGAFNINSTSVEAWKSFLGGMLGVEVNDQSSSDRAPFPRMNKPLSDTDVLAGTVTLDQEANYTGYSSVSEVDIEVLATAIVHEVRLRGPFVSLSHFVNRTVGGKAIENIELPFDVDGNGIGLFETEKERAAAEDNAFYIYRKGPLQAAIDGNAQDKINSLRNLNEHLYDDVAGYSVTIESSDYDSNDEGFLVWRDYGALFGQTKANSVNGFITQADLLARIGSAITPRSDTFKIRAYGDTRSGVSDTVNSQAWCELTVRRTPEFTDVSDASFTPFFDDLDNQLISATNRKFGRKFDIISVRWLTKDEI